MKRISLLTLSIAFVLMIQATFAFAADAAPLPPAADLEPQVDFYVAALDKVLEDAADDFPGNIEALHRDANALILVSLALGMSPEENKYKAAAPGIIAAAREMNNAKDLKTAQVTIAKIKEALTSKSEEKLEWKKVAAMAPVMKLAVPKVNTKTNTFAKSERYLTRGTVDVIAGTATLAAFSQGLLPNYDETAKPEAKEDWEKFAKAFRDAALKTNKAAHDFEAKKGDFATFKAAYDEMKADCDKCHEVFVVGGVQAE